MTAAGTAPDSRNRHEHVSRVFFELSENKKNRESSPVKENVFFTWALRIVGFSIGLLVPFVGICVYIVWRDDRPQDAKYPGLGLLITGTVVLSFLSFIIIETVLFDQPPLIQWVSDIMPEFKSDYFISFPLP